jgi:hypothetical protein
VVRRPHGYWVVVRDYDQQKIFCPKKPRKPDEMNAPEGRAVKFCTDTPTGV